MAQSDKQNSSNIRKIFVKNTTGTPDLSKNAGSPIQIRKNMTPAAKARSEQLKEILEREELFALISDATHQCFVFSNPETQDDEAWFYGSQEEAEQAAEPYRAQGNDISVVRLEKKEFLLQFASCCAYGINMLVFHVGETTIKTQVNAVMKNKENPSGQTPLRPLQNPQLDITALYYLQEARKKRETPSREVLAGMQEELSVNILRSKYIMIFDPETTNEHAKLVCLKTKEDIPVVPLFTCENELNKYSKGRKYKSGLAGLEQMLKLKGTAEIKGFLLDPAGMAFYIPFELLEKMKDKYGDFTD